MSAAPDSLAYLVSALLVTALALLPGLPLALALGDGEWDVASVLSAAFALQAGVVGLVALAAHYLGLSLAFVAVASAILLIAPAVTVVVRRRPAAPAAATPALAIAAACLVLGVWERTWFSRMADAFYHLAAVRSLVITGRPMVTDPLFGTASTVLDPTSGVWHTALACWSKATGLDVAAWLWPGAAAAGAAITALALWSLARTVTGSGRAAAGAVIGWIALVLSADLRWSGYPNHLALAVAFVALAALARLIARPNLRDAALAVVAGFATLAMHMAAAEMLALVGCVLVAVLAARAVLVRVRERAWSPRPLIAAAATGVAVNVLAVPLLLPKVGLVEASPLIGFQSAQLAAGVVRLPGGWLVDSPGHLMRISPLLFVLGAAAAALALARGLAGGRANDLMAAALGLAPLALLADPPLTTTLLRTSYYLTERVAILLPFTAFVGIGWALALPSLPARARNVALAVCAAAAIAAVGVAATASPRSWSPSSPTSVLASRSSDVRAEWGVDAMRLLSTELGRGYPVVASDPETSYYLAGVLPVAVVGVTSQHTPFAFEIADGQARRTSLETLMRPGTPERTRREILRDRHAAYVVVPKYRGGFGRTLEEMRGERRLLSPVGETRTLALFRVTP